MSSTDTPAEGSPRTRVEQLFEQGERAWRAGHYREAVRAFRETLAQAPGHVEARLGLAHSLEGDDNLDAAVATLTEAITAAPDQTEYLALRGALHARLNRLTEAEEDLRRVLRLHPAHGPALVELGDVLLRRGRPVEAVEAFSRSLAVQPDRPGMQLRLGDALNRADRLEDSAVALERALAEAPDNRRAWHLYGRVLDRLERPDDAVRAYRRAQGIDA